MEIEHIAYGPVPSRRLGRSLGINNVPPKACSYSCVYCQLGDTVNVLVGRKKFHKAEDVARIVGEKVKRVKDRGETVDYLTFVADGESTLDVDLGQEIELLKPLGIRIAVITNASLICREDVRRDLQKADWVSLKVDAVSGEIWRRINRAPKPLELEAILEGMLGFATTFGGELATESMLVQGMNSSVAEIEGIADFLVELKPNIAYLAVPTRPPAKKAMAIPSEQAINAAYQILSQRLARVEYLIGYEGNAFASSGDVEGDLLGITLVHPMREEAVTEFLRKSGGDWGVVEKLVNDGSLIELEYRGSRFYVRKLPWDSRDSWGER